MVEFSVTLKQHDLKNFIFDKIEIKNLKFWIPIILCFLLATAISVANIWLKFGVFVWCVVVTLLCMGFLPIYRAIKFFKSMFVKGLELVDKNRKFFFDERSLYILQESESMSYSRYFFYDLQNFKQTTSYLFLTFNRKVYIIIPKRCLKKEQLKEVIFILEKVQK